MEPPPSHRATNHQYLLYFSVVDFEHDFMVRKVDLGKDDGNTSNDHESQMHIVDPFSQFCEITLKQEHNLCWNKIA